MTTKHRLTVAKDNATITCRCGTLSTRSNDEAWAHLRDYGIRPVLPYEFAKIALVGGLLLALILAIFVFHVFVPEALSR